MARDNYARIEVGATSRPDWIYLVPTVDPRDFRDRWHAFRAMGEFWDHRLRERLQREFGKLEYINTWEQHRSGWPHGNFLLRSDALLAHVRELGVEVRKTTGHNGEQRDALFPFYRRELARILPECGFGSRVWAELIEPSSAHGMAAYLAKHSIADEFTRSRLKGSDQRCLDAPRGFRGLRSSRGLLPPRKTGSGNYTGFLVKRPIESLADPETGELALTQDDVARLWIESVHTEQRASMRRAVNAWRARWGTDDPGNDSED